MRGKGGSAKVKKKAETNGGKPGEGKRGLGRGARVSASSFVALLPLEAGRVSLGLARRGQAKIYDVRYAQGNSDKGLQGGDLGRKGVKAG